jgi:phosphatidylglycerol:prolipoprotein diacylglycerol transferase
VIGPENIAPWLPLSWLGPAILVGSLLGAWWAGRALPRFGIEAAYIWTIYPVAMIAGVVGAKLWAAAEALRSPGCVPLSQALWSGRGATFYGGLILGALAVVAKVVYDRKSLWAVTTALAPTLALSQAIGRIGCFLVGCCQGVATMLPWGMAFPNARPPTTQLVHPTQLYESAWLFACAWFLRRRLDRSPLLIAEYLLLQGGGRFGFEFIRTNPRVLGPLTLSQLVAISCVLSGAVALHISRRVDSLSEGR